MTGTTAVATVAQFIPSPGKGVWHIGPLPIRGYALAIILGIVASIWVGERRWQARGGRPGDVQDLAVWAVPFGLVGGRLYHVATDHDLYFGPGRSAWDILYVWRGGLGIWGSVALGAVGVLIAARIKGIRFWPVLDALSPAVLVAQGIGRWGNWFNQELFGKPTTLPWALKIDPEHRPDGYEKYATFHPTFLYECIWDLGVFGVLLALDRRFKFGHGRMLALYVMGYTLGRGWIETLRIDVVEYEKVHGLRFNVWTSIVLFLVALVFFIVQTRRHPGQEAEVYRPGKGPRAESRDGRTDGGADGEASDGAEVSTGPANGGPGAAHDPETAPGGS